MNRTEPPAPPKGRILFVDDEPVLLLAIERMLYPMRELWDCEYVNDADAALARLDAAPFHVMVSDMRMPGMNGVELLTHVAKSSPDTVRVILTGNADFQTAMDAVNEGHVFQFLLKPCEGDRFIQSLTAALRQYQLQQAERELFMTQIQHTEKMTVIGQLAAGITHDLNNILTGIMMHSELGLLNSPETSATSSFQEIKEAAERAAELTRELNGFSRSDRDGKFRALDLRGLVEATVRMVRPMMKKQIDLQIEIPPGLRRVYGDAGKLKQLLLNLLINSRDAIISGKGVIRITAHEAGSTICLSVIDNGCGMDEATRKRLFEPFFTTKEAGKGTGLGLFMIGKLLELHHGSLELESAVGCGTTFRIFLPLTDDSKVNPRNSAPLGEDARSGAVPCS